MKVFISWSGERSRATAELLAEWLQCVIQSVRPWISVRDIDRGALWFTEISDQLKETSIGIVCLTNENKERPWILFEAGALAKGLATNRVCTLLVDLQPNDIGEPLSQFNHTTPQREDILKLVKTINRLQPVENLLSDPVLTRAFDTYWPQFDAAFAELLSTFPAGKKPKPRDDKEVLAEMLELVKGISHRVSKLEHDRKDSVAINAWAKFSDAARQQAISDAIANKQQISGSKLTSKLYKLYSEQLLSETSPDTQEDK